MLVVTGRGWLCSGCVLWTTALHDDHGHHGDIWSLRVRTGRPRRHNNPPAVERAAIAVLVAASAAPAPAAATALTK